MKNHLFSLIFYCIARELFAWDGIAESLDPDWRSDILTGKYLLEHRRAGTQSSLGPVGITLVSP